MTKLEKYKKKSKEGLSILLSAGIFIVVFPLAFVFFGTGKIGSDDIIFPLAMLCTLMLINIASNYICDSVMVEVLKKLDRREKGESDVDAAESAYEEKRARKIKIAMVFILTITLIFIIWYSYIK